MRRICIAVMIISIVLLLGTAGAIDQNTITFKQGVIQYSASIISGLIAWGLLVRHEGKGK